MLYLCLWCSRPLFSGSAAVPLTATWKAEVNFYPHLLKAQQPCKDGEKSHSSYLSLWFFFFRVKLYNKIRHTITLIAELVCQHRRDILLWKIEQRKWKEKKYNEIKSHLFQCSYERKSYIKKQNVGFFSFFVEGRPRTVFWLWYAVEAASTLCMPAVVGLDVQRFNCNILPEYEQQICQCVTGWQPSSQLLVHCC